MSGNGLWPLELTCHGQTTGENNSLVWAADALTLYCQDPVVTRNFFIDGLGFVNEGSDVLSLCSRLPGWSCRLKILRSNASPVTLDASGPTCLAFYSNRPGSDAKVLLDLGASDYTGTFDIRVGTRDLNIAVLRAPCGILLELINPRTRH